MFQDFLILSNVSRHFLAFSSVPFSFISYHSQVFPIWRIFSLDERLRTRYRAYREVGGQFFPEDGDLVVSGLCMDTHTWVERISKNTLAQIESFQEKHKCPTVPLRQEWMREGAILLAGKKIYKGAPKCIRKSAEVGDRQFVVCWLFRLFGCVRIGFSNIVKSFSAFSGIFYSFFFISYHFSSIFMHFLPFSNIFMHFL